jgi:CheY-like chemotaxis protein
MKKRKNVTVLLVEGEERLRRVVSASLDQLGLRVLTAGEAQSALQILKDEHPEVLIVENDHPHGNNGEVIDVFRGEENDLPRPVVVTTTQRLGDQWRKQYQPQVAIYKPFDVRHLSRVVGTLLGMRGISFAEVSTELGVVND